MELVGHPLRHLHLAFHIVVVLFEAPQLLHVLRIIGIVVVDIHRGIFLKTFEEHTLAIHIGKTHRTNHLRHSAFTAPLLYCFQQGSRHFLVVYEVEPAEAHLLMLPAFVGTAIDNCCHSTHGAPVLISQKIVRLTAFKGCIAVAAQRVHLVRI